MARDFLSEQFHLLGNTFLKCRGRISVFWGNVLRLGLNTNSEMRASPDEKNNLSAQCRIGNVILITDMRAGIGFTCGDPAQTGCECQSCDPSGTDRLLCDQDKKIQAEIFYCA
jgi:hypothetical protein